MITLLADNSTTSTSVPATHTETTSSTITTTKATMFPARGNVAHSGHPTTVEVLVFSCCCLFFISRLLIILHAQSFSRQISVVGS